jgi:signal transduction histidine kinase/ActR/RegA family two-component response regulator
VPGRYAELHQAFHDFALLDGAPAELLALAGDALRKRFLREEVLVQGSPQAGLPEASGGQEPSAAGALQAFAAAVLQDGRPSYLHDTRRSRRPAAAALAQAGLRQAAAFPCMGPDGPLAVLAVAHRSPGALAAELGCLTGLAAHLGSILQAGVQRASLRQSCQALKDAQGQRVGTERLAAVGQMAAGVAHDFNNMLASIMVRAELLRQVLTDPEWTAHLEVIERAAHDGARTIRRLQEFTRQGSTQDFRPVDLNTAVRDSLEIAKSRWKDDAQLAGIAIEVRTKLGEVPPMHEDVSELREILTNLIVNAVDAMPRGGGLTLATRWLPAPNRVELTVSDTGIGMTEEIRAQIFDPFFTTKGPGGSGLGLSVSYGIIKRHGGDITVQTAPGTGTTFTVTLPAAAAGAAEAAEAPAAAPDPLRVLVIDDEEPFRLSLYTALHREGHFVAVAASGEEGLRLFGISRFDVVLTDLGMPGMGGWQVAQAVKRMRPRTPVILITGWGATLSEADRARPEVDAILGKPVTSKAILQALARLRVRGQCAPRRARPGRRWDGGATP